MGREVKRVPLDFEWPLNKPWQGYLNPHDAQCSACKGTGSTVASQRLEDLVSLLMLSGTDARSGKCHPYFYEAPLYRTRGKVCGSDMAELTEALAGRAPSFFGHDCVDQWSARKKIITAAGLPESWGVCPECDGHGQPRDVHAASEAWQRTQPPTGPGYQIWETVSEGSPISPVFATAEELARHMTTTRWGADKGTDYDTWLKFINGPGWAPSLVMDADGVRDGVNM